MARSCNLCSTASGELKGLVVLFKLQWNFEVSAILADLQPHAQRVKELYLLGNTDLELDLASGFLHLLFLFVC